MNSTQPKPASWFAQHWMLTLNTFFVVFALLPLFAPMLMYLGYPNIAEGIYRLYRITCHQLPDHSDFIVGHQIAVCQRCNAIHLMSAGAGFMYALHLLRPAAITFKWFLLFVIPIAVDGGLAWVSDLLTIIPHYWFWLLGIALLTMVALFLYKQRLINWQIALFLAAGPASLLYLQTFGPHQSNWWLRNITGSIYGLGTIWFIYAMVEREMVIHTQDRLKR